MIVIAEMLVTREAKLIMRYCERLVKTLNDYFRELDTLGCGCHTASAHGIKAIEVSRK